MQPRKKRGVYFLICGKVVEMQNQSYYLYHRVDFLAYPSCPQHKNWNPRNESSHSILKSTTASTIYVYDCLIF